ncbi:MAG: hypothetical protein J0I06_17775 [Planctomycetes bacterium]|nr:hypothetical protein [Planctomycetota bacterium]
MEKHDGQWEPIHGAMVELPEEEWPPTEEKRWAAWGPFADWFATVPGLRDREYVGIGYSGSAPGALKTRLVLALTAAGSLVGVINHEIQA